jgi:tagatose-6-phosphate ketose/aldose isomerase
VNELSKLLALPEAEKSRRGLLHTPQEIAQQPDTWVSTFELFSRRRAEIREFLCSTGLLGSAPFTGGVFLIGAGSSDYIGHALSHLLRRFWQCEVTVVPSTDLVTHIDEWVIPGRKYLWIWFSRSGDSPEGVAALARAREQHPEVRHIVVSSNAGGRMIRDHLDNGQGLAIALSDAVNDRGLAMTSSFSNMVVLGQCLAHIQNLDVYENVLSRLAQAGRDFLPRAADSAAALASEKYKKACFVASGPLRAVAKESALKLLELTAGKTLTMSESALGLRHGPMAALDHETLLISFLSSDKRVKAYEQDLLREVGNKHLAGCRVVVGGEELIPDSYGDHYLPLASMAGLADEYRPPADVIFGQLLGLFSSIQWSLMPDCPSPNGAISRVVENVSIYT